MSLLQELFPRSVPLVVLRYFFNHEQEELYSAKIALALKRDVANIHRIVRRLTALEIIREQRLQQRVVYQLNEAHPLYGVLKTLFTHEDSAAAMVSITEESRVGILGMEIIFRGLNDPRIIEHGWVPSLPHAAAVYENDYFHYYVPRVSWETAGMNFIQRLRDHQGIVDDIVKKTTAIELSILKMRQGVERCGRNRRRAVRFFDTLVREGELLCVFGFPAVVMETGTAQLSKVVESIIEPKRVARKTTASLQQLTGDLFSYPKETFTNAYRLAVLEGARAIKKGKKKDAVVQHITYEYAWISFGYKGPSLHASTVAIEIDECLHKTDSALTAEIRTLQSSIKKLRIHRERLARMLKLSHEEWNFIDAVARLAWLKLRRKDILFFINYLLYTLIKPFSSSLSLEELSYLTLDEARALIMDDRLPVQREELRARKKYSIYKTDERKVFVGNEARRFAEEHFEHTEADHTLRLLEGQTASFGNGAIVEGRAKIVRTERDIEKVQDGDILIASATIPSMLPAMKRARAIVTDVGGITSHAAIVSRELNKPCVIGVKYGTKVFKDGDHVLVCPRHAYITFRA